MSEDETTPPPAAPVAPAPKRSWKKWLIISLAMIVVVPAILLTLWSWIAVSWSFSEGDRAGYVQKFSKKGWLCKTWEGELAMVNIPGAMQERWTFTVPDDSVAQIISNSMGNQVSLHYEEKRGIPTTCFGETDYFVTGVRPVTQPLPPAQPAPTQVPPAQQTRP
jgi:hypothetical protein